MPRGGRPAPAPGGRDHADMLASYWRRFVVSLILTLPNNPRPLR